MGLVLLIAGLVLFLGTHVFVTFRAERAQLIARLGAGAYRGLFSLVSVIGIVTIGWGFALYRRTGWIDIWSPPAWLHPITLALVWVAAVLVVAAYLPGRIRSTAKHPMLAGVKLWAFAHLLSNGDLGSIILFGSFLGWGIYARIAAKTRGEAIGSNPTVKFGRGWVNDAMVIVLGTILYLILGLWFHPAVIGVAVLGS